MLFDSVGRYLGAMFLHFKRSNATPSWKSDFDYTVFRMAACPTFAHCRLMFADDQKKRPVLYWLLSAFDHSEVNLCMDSNS
jgi:hypothetical protein